MTPEVLGGIIGGLVALLGGVGAYGKLRAESARTRAEAAKIAAETAVVSRGVADVHAQLTPNHGSSLRDAADRTEGAVGQVLAAIEALGADIRDVQQALRRHDRELGRAADASEQIRDRITRLEDRHATQIAEHAQRLHYLEAIDQAGRAKTTTERTPHD